MKQITENQAADQATEATEGKAAPIVKRARKPQVDEAGNPIVKEAKAPRAPKAPKEPKAARDLKDSTKVVLEFLDSTLQAGSITKRDLWKAFNEANPALIKPAAFGSIAKRAVYSGRYIVAGAKAEALALRA